MINFIILTKTNSDEIYQMTNNLVQSLYQNTLFPDFGSFSSKRIIIGETNLTSKYQYENTTTFKFNKADFNFNRELNTIIRYCDSELSARDDDWYCFMNNDIICNKNFIIEIDNAIRIFPNLESCCPQCVNTKEDIDFGYVLFRNFCGYCFLCTKRVAEKMYPLDEQFDFYFADDDYLEKLRKFDIQHASIRKSLVHHLGSRNTNSNNISQKLIEGKNKFIAKYSFQIYLNREQEKYAK